MTSLLAVKSQNYRFSQTTGHLIDFAMKFWGKRIFEAVLRFYEESKAARILNVSNLRCKSSKSENAILELPGALW